MPRAYIRLSTAAAAVAVPLALAAPAGANNVVFDFSGVCRNIPNNCIAPSTGTATATLTLTDAYTTGTDITAADFISLNYYNGSRVFNITSADSPTFTGGLNANGSLSDGPLLIQAEGMFLSVNGNPSWEAQGLTFTEVGSSFTFKLVDQVVQDVPEPSTWAMMIIGLAALGYASYRRARAGANVA
jgi:hypothetical protein